MNNSGNRIIENSKGANLKSPEDYEKALITFKLKWYARHYVNNNKKNVQSENDESEELQTLLKEAERFNIKGNEVNIVQNEIENIRQFQSTIRMNLKDPIDIANLKALYKKAKKFKIDFREAREIKRKYRRYREISEMLTQKMRLSTLKELCEEVKQSFKNSGYEKDLNDKLSKAEELEKRSKELLKQELFTVEDIEVKSVEILRKIELSNIELEDKEGLVSIRSSLCWLRRLYAILKDNFEKEKDQIYTKKEENLDGYGTREDNINEMIDFCTKRCLKRDTYGRNYLEYKDMIEEGKKINHRDKRIREISNYHYWFVNAVELLEKPSIDLEQDLQHLCEQADVLGIDPLDPIYIRVKRAHKTHQSTVWKKKFQNFTTSEMFDTILTENPHPNLSQQIIELFNEYSENDFESQEYKVLKTAWTWLKWSLEVNLFYKMLRSGQKVSLDNIRGLLSAALDAYIPQDCALYQKTETLFAKQSEIWNRYNEFRIQKNKVKDEIASLLNIDGFKKGHKEIRIAKPELDKTKELEKALVVDSVLQIDPKELSAIKNSISKCETFSKKVENLIGFYGTKTDIESEQAKMFEVEKELDSLNNERVVLILRDSKSEEQLDHFESEFNRKLVLYGREVHQESRGENNTSKSNNALTRKLSIDGDKIMKSPAELKNPGISIEKKNAESKIQVNRVNKDNLSNKNSQLIEKKMGLSSPSFDLIGKRKTLPQNGNEKKLSFHRPNQEDPSIDKLTKAIKLTEKEDNGLKKKSVQKDDNNAENMVTQEIRQKAIRTLVDNLRINRHFPSTIEFQYIAKQIEVNIFSQYPNKLVSYKKKVRTTSEFLHKLTNFKMISEKLAKSNFRYSDIQEMNWRDLNQLEKELTPSPLEKDLKSKISFASKDLEIIEKTKNVLEITSKAKNTQDLVSNSLTSNEKVMNIDGTSFYEKLQKRFNNQVQIENDRVLTEKDSKVSAKVAEFGKSSVGDTEDHQIGYHEREKTLNQERKAHGDVDVDVRDEKEKLNNPENSESEKLIIYIDPANIKKEMITKISEAKLEQNILVSHYDTLECSFYTLEDKETINRFPKIGSKINLKYMKNKKKSLQKIDKFKGKNEVLMGWVSAKESKSQQIFKEIAVTLQKEDKVGAIDSKTCEFGMYFIPPCTVSQDSLKKNEWSSLSSSYNENLEPLMYIVIHLKQKKQKEKYVLKKIITPAESCSAPKNNVYNHPQQPQKLSPNFTFRFTPPQFPRIPFPFESFQRIPPFGNIPTYPLCAQKPFSPSPIHSMNSTIFFNQSFNVSGYNGTNMNQTYPNYQNSKNTDSK